MDHVRLFRSPWDDRSRRWTGFKPCCQPPKGFDVRRYNAATRAKRRILHCHRTRPDRYIYIYIYICVCVCVDQMWVKHHIFLLRLVKYSRDRSRSRKYFMFHSHLVYIYTLLHYWVLREHCVTMFRAIRGISENACRHVTSFEPIPLQVTICNLSRTLVEWPQMVPSPRYLTSARNITDMPMLYF